MGKIVFPCSERAHDTNKIKKKNKGKRIFLISEGLKGQLLKKMLDKTIG